MELQVGRALNPIPSLPTIPGCSKPSPGLARPKSSWNSHFSHSLNSCPSFLRLEQSWRKIWDLTALFPLFFRYHLEFPSRGESGWEGLDWETFPVLNSRKKKRVFMDLWGSSWGGKIPYQGISSRRANPRISVALASIPGLGSFPETPKI